MIPAASDTDLISIKEVIRSVGLQKTAIYDRCKRGEFPKPRKLGAASRWVRGEVEAWKKALATKKTLTN